MWTTIFKNAKVPIIVTSGWIQCPHPPIFFYLRIIFLATVLKRGNIKELGKSDDEGCMHINPLTPNDPDRGRTAPLTFKVAFYIFIQQIYLLNILNMLYIPFQNAVCFIILTYLFPVLFTFYIQSVLKLKKKIPAPKG